MKLIASDTQKLRLILTIILTSLLVACGGGTSNDNVVGDNSTGVVTGPGPDDPSDNPLGGDPDNPSETPPDGDFDDIKVVEITTLKWEIPTATSEGEPLHVGEIKGYEVQYSRAGEFSEVVFVDGGTTNELQLEDLAEGTYQFRIATVTINDIYSDFTLPVEATISDTSTN